MTLSNIRIEIPMRQAGFRYCHPRYGGFPPPYQIPLSKKAAPHRLFAYFISGNGSKSIKTPLEGSCGPV